MRPAKDLKDMITRARGGTGSFLEEHLSDQSSSLLDTSHSSTKHLNNPSFVQTGRTSLGGAPPSGKSAREITLSLGVGDMQNRLKKLQELSTSDKDVIEAMQKKLTNQKIEFETLQQKYSSLVRNYEGVANFAASDKAEFTRLKNGREAAEKET